jgi:hypothetical protein
MNDKSQVFAFYFLRNLGEEVMAANLRLWI